MKRKTFLKGSAASGLLVMLPREVMARPSWPSAASWAKLDREVGGRLMRVPFPIREAMQLRNPNYIGDQPGITQTLGWVDAWTTKPSLYAVAPRSAEDIAAAVAFARDHRVRLVVKGGGHSYQGTSNAPDSLLVWTRPMHEVILDGNSVSIDAGAIWMHAYDAVTTIGGRYVQGGGCTTVGVAGLIQSGGFGSFSKRFGTAAGGLLEAEVITADGKVRRVNATSDPDLFWALKGGGGGTFGIVSRVKLLVHDLPETFGAAIATITASSASAYQRLVSRFVSFYAESLFNEHWGETVHFSPRNVLNVSMVAQGFTSSEIAAIWKPFFDWIKASPADYSLSSDPITIGVPARHWWDPTFWKANAPSAISLDPRPGHANDWWWAGDGEQAAWFLYGYESLWLPKGLLASGSQASLSEALFAASRHFSYELHFNKGLAGAPSDAIARARDTAMNPSVLDAFALAISADAQGPAYPGIPGHEPDVAAGRESAKNITQCMNELRSLAPQGGAYLSESSYFQSDFKDAYWGSHYARLSAVKKKYDPDGVFSVHNGVS